MAGGITGKASSIALNYLTGRSAGLSPVPQTMLLALLTAAPPANPMVSQLGEAESTGYFRQSLSFAAAKNDVPGQPSSIESSGNVLFGPFTDASGLGFPVTHCAVIGQTVPESVANLLSANASSVETDVSAWQSLLNAELSSSTAQFRSGVRSMSVAIAAAGDSQVGLVTGVSVTPLTTYKASAWVFSPTAGVQARVDLPIYDGEGGQIIYNTVSYVTLAANTWTEVSIQRTAPPNAATAKPVLRTTATAGGQTVFWDVMSLVPVADTAVLMTWQFDTPGTAAQNESLQISAGDLRMSLG